MIDFRQKEQSEAPSELGERFLGRVRAALERGGNDWHRVYLLRAVHRLAGVDGVQVLMNRPNRSWVFPSEVLRLQVSWPEWVAGCETIWAGPGRASSHVYSGVEDRLQ